MHMFVVFNLQKYIGEKVSPDEVVPWVRSQIEKGFAGKCFCNQLLA